MRRLLRRLSQSIKLLLTITALAEGATGVALLLIPALAVPMLLGAPLDTPAGLVASRIGGAAIIGLAIECWQARNGERGSPATGVVEAMLFYNFAAALVLVYAGSLLELRSALLWPAIVFHFVLGAWCVLSLWLTRRKLNVAPLT